MKVGHIGGTARHPLRGGRGTEDEDDLRGGPDLNLDAVPDEPEDEDLGTTFSLPLFISRDELLRMWAGISDAPTIDRGWGAIPALPGTPTIENRALAAALDRGHSCEAVVVEAARARWAMYVGVDLAGSTKHDADETVLVTLAAEPKTDRLYVADLRHGRFTLPQQVDHVREVDDLYAPAFVWIESNANPALALHLAGLCRRAGAIPTTKANRPVMLAQLSAAFLDHRIVIPDDARSRRLLDPLTRQLRVFPRGRYDDAVLALAFAIAAAQKMPPQRKPIPSVRRLA